MKSKKIRFKESEVLSKLDKEKRELELALSRMSLKVHCLKIASKICTEEGVAFKYMIASEFFVLAAATPALLNQGVFSGDNLIGDVCGDQAVALVGGLGVAPTRSINTTGRTNKVFAEPLHGTAPDIAGKNIADPVAMIQTSGMVLSHFGYPEEARLLSRAVYEAIESGNRTADMPNSPNPVSTTEMSQAVMGNSRRLLREAA